MITRLLTLSLLLTSFCTFAQAQEASGDDEWPCAQQLVPSIAAAQVWSGDLPDAGLAMTAPFELAEVGRSSMDSRIPDDQVIKNLKGYFAKVKSAKVRQEQVPLVFLVALTEANAQRDRQIKGIKNFTRGQFALSKKLAADVAQLDKLTEGQPAKENTPAKDIENNVQLQRRVFEDREHQVKYLCEAPAGVEARLGVVARTLEGVLAKK